MLKQVKLHLLDTGYCKNFEKMVSKNKPWRIQHFHALVGLIEHPTLGPILFDTGYSTHLIQLCKHIPYLLYPLITPLHFHESLSAANQIQKYGYKPEEIKHIIISHFHPDHIAGLKDFPNARFYGSTNTYFYLKQLSKIKSLKELFFQNLLPDDFEKRFHPFDHTPCTLPYTPFTQGYDLFGDSSIIAVNLPGHAAGQIGIFIQTSFQTILLVADACWQSDNYLHLEQPHFLARSAIYDYSDYCATLQLLHDLKTNHSHIEIIPSHCQVMWERYAKRKKPC